MPDKRIHRGPNPQDARLFAPAQLENLIQAVTDYSLLLTKGYAEKSALKLVGDRFSLTKRQRLAVMRCACSDQQLASRNRRRVELSAVRAQPVVVDGYNVLITVEAAISGGVILRGRDGCFKDLASVHGTYRKVTETIPAVEIIGDFLHQAGAMQFLWLLDSPVSNSGRLKNLIEKLAAENNFNWQVKLTISPDAELKKTDLVVATSDGVVLDECKSWVNLARELIETKLPQTRLIDLTPPEVSA